MHSFAESACEPHQTTISVLLRFCCVHKCPSRTRLAHISDYCSFLHKNLKRENMLQNRARNTCGICTCHGCLQNDSVARHFLQKGDCHSRISSRLSRKHLRNSNKCICSHLILRFCVIVFKFRTSQMTTSLLIHR